VLKKSFCLTGTKLDPNISVPKFDAALYNHHAYGAGLADTKSGDLLQINIDGYEVAYQQKNTNGPPKAWYFDSQPSDLHQIQTNLAHESLMLPNPEHGYLLV
jgi:hypothetical protein